VNFDLIIVGGVMMVVGFYAVFRGESAFRESPQYRSLEWLADIPNHGRLLSCLWLIWVLACAGGIMYAASNGHARIPAYLALAAVVLLVWWANLRKLDRFMTRLVQDSLNYSHTRRTGIVIAAVGFTVFIVGLIIE
jgi:hypothetical protein